MTSSEMLVQVNRRYRFADGAEKYGRGWPKHPEGVCPESEVMTLTEALTRRFPYQAYLVAHAPTCMNIRLTTCLLSNAEALARIGGAVRVQLFLADVDNHDLQPEEVDAWFDSEERPKIEALREAHPALLVYRSKGGYRIVGTLRVSELSSNVEAGYWATLTMGWRAYLARRFGINVDPLHDWTRYQRVPHDTRDPEAGPEEREIIGSVHDIGEWAPVLSDEDLAAARAALAPKTKPRATTAMMSTRAAGAPTFFRKLLEARGLLGAFDGEKWHTLCPDEAEHGTPSRAPDGSCVLYEDDREWGGIYCLHSNCGHDRRRGAKDWMTCFSSTEIEAAKLACGKSPKSNGLTPRNGSGGNGAATYQAPALPAAAPANGAIQVDMINLISAAPVKSNGGNGAAAYQAAAPAAAAPPAPAPANDIKPGARSQKGREDWRSLLEYTAGSKERPPMPKRCLANVLTTLLHCPAWGGVLRYDEFSDRVLVATELPRAKHHESESSRGVWREGHAPWTVAWFGDVLGFEPSIDWVERAVDEVARSNGFHPVLEYLRGLRWDGSHRLDEMLVDFFGAEDSEVVRAVAAKWMISCVARVVRPGCQVDHLLVLEGVQGTRKSTALRVLVGDDWFRNSPIDLRNKDAAMALRGCWVYEFDELDAFRGRDATRIKSFITIPKDSYRPAYGRLTIDVLRQCAFAGSTNEERYLIDPTGNRRFWPVRCGAIDVPGLTAARDQLWAEAYARHAAGELWYVDDPALEAQLRAAQSEREEIDPWTALLQTWLEELYEGTRSRGVTAEEALVAGLELKPGQTTRRDEMRVAVCLKRLGWLKQRELRGGARQYRYYPPEPEIAQPAQPVPNLANIGWAGSN